MSKATLSKRMRRKQAEFNASIARLRVPHVPTEQIDRPVVWWTHAALGASVAVLLGYMIVAAYCGVP